MDKPTAGTQQWTQTAEGPSVSIQPQEPLDFEKWWMGWAFQNSKPRSRHNYTLGQAVRAAWDAASAERRVAPRELQIADDVDLLVSTMNDSNKGLMKVAIRHQMTKLRELAAAPAEHSLRAAPLTPMRRPTS